ncbi:MAG: cell division ATP-binding protein FtsE [Patescibacteria group bacterium]
MIHFKNITKIYPPDACVLENINLFIKPGEFVSIIGQSGSGKTTLMKLLVAEEKATEGEIIVGGWNISDIKPKDVPLLRRQIGNIFQDFKLLPNKTVFENIAFALHVCDASNAEIDRIVPQAIKVVGLEGKEDRFPRQLSGGEKQRVAIARALSHQPKIIIADEPTGNLDTHHTNDIIELLKKINSFGTTVILVSHEKDVVNRLKRRVVTLENGRIISDQENSRYVL